MQSDVLFGMLLTLLQKKKVSARELSLKYEISTRTVFRYVDVLSQAGVPLFSVSGPQGGISIMDNFKLDKTYFTENEMARIVSSIKSVSSVFNDNLSDQILTKLAALNSNRQESYILKSDQLFIDSSPWGLYHFKDKMTVIEKAIVDRRVLNIDYHSRSGEITHRAVEPHTLVLKDSIWYTYAFCRLRNEFRLFKIGRIKNIQETKEFFEPKPVNIEDAPYNSNWYSEENVTDIILQLNEKARPDVEEWLGIESVKQNKQGQIFAYAKVPFDQGLLFKIMSFGSNVKVIEPLKLIDMIKKDCRNILELYGG